RWPPKGGCSSSSPSGSAPAPLPTALGPANPARDEGLASGSSGEGSHAPRRWANFVAARGGLTGLNENLKKGGVGLKNKGFWACRGMGPGREPEPECLTKGRHVPC